MTNLAGEITESAVANTCFVRDGAIQTPPLCVGILEGITRASVLGPVARAAGVRVHETSLRLEDLSSFTECFITGTTREIHPVSAIDDVRFNVGPDTVTARLQRAFRDHTSAYVAKHRRLRVLPRGPKLCLNQP